ncbi:MAG: hypothetical protein HDS03_02100 [Bacteroides sp.]|nr:hypothetical protein [Bacteroides sp.]MDE7440824.1 hypothetical protein [Muribaculaceae bacterium]
MLVLIILVAMVMILLGINQLFSGNLQTEEEDINRFRNEINDKDDVMTSQNLFRKFLGR